jgi:iron complex outermembrane receptor protein
VVKQSRQLLLTGLALASGLAHAGKDLSELDFLSEPPVVLTASRIAQSVMDAPNAVTVLDRETILTSGYTRVADLFLLVPGMFVGEMSGWNQTVSHSFADQFERRMQVMIDGRSVYLPTFGGVDWDSLPIVVDDIERIEVVRGANAASYGANAFTGIINIITRHPADQAGRALELGLADNGGRSAWLRWAADDPRLQQRLTLATREDEGFAQQIDDAARRVLNYRADFSLSGQQGMSLQLAASDGERLDRGPNIQRVCTWSLQLDYRRQLDARRALQAKLYDSALFNKEYTGTGSSSRIEDQSGERRHAEIQVDSQVGTDLRATLGAYIRQDAVHSRYFLATSKKKRVDSSGLFGVIEWRMANQWLLHAGAFSEDYELVGNKLSPRLALNWQPSQNFTLRLAMAQAYRNPVLYESAGYKYVDALASFFPIGEPDLRPEAMLSRELGLLWRWPEGRLTLDLRLFSDKLSDYIGFKLDQANPLASKFGNWGDASQRGGEMQLKWQPHPHTQVIANYAEFHIDSQVTNNDTVGESAPRHLASLHLMHRMPFEIDAYLAQHWVSSLTPIQETRPVPFYRRLDVGVHKHFRLSGRQGVVAITSQNLTGGHYSLFDDGRQEGMADRKTTFRLQLDF